MSIAALTWDGTRKSEILRRLEVAKLRKEISAGLSNNIDWWWVHSPALVLFATQLIDKGHCVVDGFLSTDLR